MTAQDWGGVITQEVPDDVYDDFLEHFLLLSGCRHLCELSTRDGVPSCLGMFSRNGLGPLGSHQPGRTSEAGVPWLCG